MLSGLIDLVEKRPRAAFAGFLAVHAAVWTLLPTILYPNLPLDLIEALTYGREWQIGYDKLPPLPWWLVEIVHLTIGADVGYYLLAQITVVAAFALVWATARPLVGTLGALVSVAIIDGLHYFNFTAPKFNHDVVQLPLWALAGYAFHRALRSGRMPYWILLGLALGAALWAKYFVVILALPLAAFLLFDREARPALATPGPYVAAAVALLVALPHLVWLVNNDFLPLSYAEARAAPTRGALDHIVRPLAFAGGQALWLIPSLLIALPLFRPRKPMQPSAADAFDRRIVTLLTFGPAVLLIAASVLTGRRLITMWGYPLWLFLGLWLVIVARTPIERPRLARMAVTWGIVTALYAVAFVADYAVMPNFDHRHRASLFPGDRLAQEIAGGFKAATGRPLAYVIGSMWLGGNIGHYAAEQPRTLIDGKPARTPWINLADLRARGAVVVWSDGDRTKLPAEYAAIAAGAEVQKPLTLPFRRGQATTELGWAILKPAP
ncbi:MAG TPA: glycosyltransferase family 39 protein [Xanthobacteraceae bacterium]|jgi:4-amino-4-deoxy-L-arabinose transferase-like glycosyltransferase|nr:glycosyltransferase family 39 protein [Xanthobacteraceae bacterium]